MPSGQVPQELCALQGDITPVWSIALSDTEQCCSTFLSLSLASEKNTESRDET